MQSKQKKNQIIGIFKLSFCQGKTLCWSEVLPTFYNLSTKQKLMEGDFSEIESWKQANEVQFSKPFTLNE